MSKGEVTVRVDSLRWARKMAKLSQAALADRATAILKAEDDDAQISESLIALIETNRRQPSRRNVEAIYKAICERFADAPPLELICDLSEADEVTAA